MNTRALTLAISLLSAAVGGAVLVGTSGCGVLSGCGDPWQDAEALNLNVSVDLHAVTSFEDDDGEREYRHLAVGADGTIVIVGREGHDPSPFVEQFSHGAVDLRGVWAEPGAWWVVGDGGTATVSGDYGQTWSSVELGTDADLHAIARFGSQLVVVGDEIVLVQNADGTWSEPTAPGGWGRLRGLYYHEPYETPPRLYAVGLDGVIWSTADPAGEWVPETSGTQADLFAISDMYFRTEETVFAVGAGGTVLVRKSSGWDRIANDESVDLIDCAGEVVLGANGELFELSSRAKLSLVDTLARARAVDQRWEGVVAVGGEGVAYEKDYYVCVGGRPFVVDGRPRMAALRRGKATVERQREVSADAPSLALRQHLAEAWARDGLYEHASVASFARFALELLALGAPPQLLRAVSGASLDELRHARACFALARGFGGVDVGPGPMPLPASAFARVGDPVATALALFEEACVNESVAACEAMCAAAQSEDPQLRHVLEGIAADERRHAVVGWNALRWLLNTHGTMVRAPLHARVARLHSPTRPLGNDDDEHDLALGAHGRMPTRHREAVRAEVIERFVRPFARALLDAHVGAQSGVPR